MGPFGCALLLWCCGEIMLDDCHEQHDDCDGGGEGGHDFDDVGVGDDDGGDDDGGGGGGF